MARGDSLQPLLHGNPLTPDTVLVAGLGHDFARAELLAEALTHRSALDRLAIDLEDIHDHPDAVAGQADDALDVVGAVHALALVARVLEDRHVAPLGLLAEDPAGEEAHREKE